MTIQILNHLWKILNESIESSSSMDDWDNGYIAGLSRAIEELEKIRDAL